MTKEGRMIGAKIYRDATDEERKKNRNVSCYKEYYEELKDELDPKPKEEVKEPEKAPIKPKKGKGKK